MVRDLRGLLVEQNEIAALGLDSLYGTNKAALFVPNSETSLMA